MNKSNKLIFFGTEQFSLYALEALVENGYDVEAVVTKPDSRKGRGKVLTPSLVKQFALSANIPVIQHENIDEIKQELANYQTDFAVLSAFGRIIPNSILAMFDGGIINIHPSLLPKYRGASPIEQAIISGDSETGVSLMQLVKEMDAGPVFAQAKLQLVGNETAPQLYESLGNLGSNLLLEKLPEIISGQLLATDQDDALVSFAPMILKADGQINWDDTAQTIERQIRAYLHWPGSKTTINSIDVAITKAQIGNASGRAGEVYVNSDDLSIYCGNGSLIVEKLKPASKREMTSKDFLLGNKII